jgi:predicted nucleic acid-binding protein
VAGRVSGALLDTSLLIAHDETGAFELPEAAAISVITLGELRAGVLMARDGPLAPARRGRLAAVRAVFAALAVDEVVAERYGDVLAIARSRGRTVKATDLLIIATAAATGRRLFTRDAAQSRLARSAGVAATLV